jgi:transposase
MYSNDFICLALRFYNARKETNLSIQEILQIIGIARSTLFEWIKQYSNDLIISKSVDDPTIRPPERQFNRRFFPNNITDDCLKYITDTVLEEKVINANNICRNIKKKFKVVISKNYLYQILKDNNITYKVAQKVSYPHDQNKFEQQTQQLKEKINDVNQKLNFTDEMAIYLTIKPNYGWSKRGEICMIKQPKSYANKSSNRFSIAMSMTKKKVINYSLIRGTFNAKRFKRYMTKTLSKMGDTIPFMDNARAHTAKHVQQYLENHDKKPIFNVPYSPQFNPIEYLFNTLKAAIKRQTFQSESSIRRFINKFIKKINEQGLENYCKKSMSNLYNN